jgi:hypothetical protein
MKTRKLLLPILIFGVFFTMTASVFAQKRGGKVGHELLKTLKPGRWIDIAGIPQPDMTLFIHKINILTGDFEADDWEAKGIVTNVDFEKKEFRLRGGITVRVNDETEYDKEKDAWPKDFSGFSSIREGLLLQAEGTFLKDGIFEAEEIENKLIDPEDSDSRELSLVGKMDAIDLDKNTLKIMDVRFKILPTTRIKNKFK